MIVNALRTLFEHFKAYHSHGQPIIQYSGLIGLAAFPLFYLLRFAKAEAPFDDIGLRILAMLLCAGMALRTRWPERLAPYYFGYAYVTLLYCMPFFFIFTSLVNGGGVVAVANTLMAVFFLILLSDWRNSVVILLLGGAAATLLYVAVVTEPRLPRDYVARLPVLILVVIGGSVFKYAQKQALTEKVKLTYTALAGSIAHEMRNPLGQIKHNLERIQNALPSPTTTPQSQTLAANQVDALYRHLAESELAVNRGLQVIAMTLDEVSAKPVDTAAPSYLSAADATHKAVQEYAFESDTDAGRVSVHVEEDFTFRGGETAYLFVLFNLIKNALYYRGSHPDARVTITIARQRVMVHDTGPGIPSELISRLFEPFSSVGKSGGTGLGLAYCRRVMLAFGGEIACDSVEGEFTCFTLSFPPVSAQENQTHRQAALERARAAFAGKRILIVDDDAAQRMTTRHKLQPLEVAVDQAADGLRALDELSARHYDLVLIDLTMPVMDGYAVAERIRRGQVPANRDVRIVAYTSEPAHLATVKTQKAGMDGFISKPCDQLPLLQALHHALERPSAAAAPDVALAGRRVLLADDSPQNRKAVAAYLKAAGMVVLEAAHGAAVLEQLAGPNECHAILMDISMPGMDGLETARRIRAGATARRGVPIVALTAHSDQGTVQAALAAGMNDFLVKPVDAAVLCRKLAQLIGGDLPTLPAPEIVFPASTASNSALLNLERLESYRRLGILRELLDDCLPEIARLVEQLEASVARHDLPATLEALHSLLGLSGEAGAQALYQQVRRIYVPMVETRNWPAAPDWVAPIATLLGESQTALSRYGAMQTTANAD